MQHELSKMGEELSIAKRLVRVHIISTYICIHTRPPAMEINFIIFLGKTLMIQVMTLERKCEIFQLSR